MNLFVISVPKKINPREACATPLATEFQKVNGKKAVVIKEHSFTDFPEVWRHLLVTLKGATRNVLDPIEETLFLMMQRVKRIPKHK